MTSEAKKRIRAAAVELFGDEIGCTDGGCAFGHPGGMHTNGGCMCLKSRDVTELRRTAQMLSRVAIHLAETSS